MCRNQVSKLKDIIKMCEINFLSEIALKCYLERLSMQKRVTVLLKGECFAPPSAMNHENALRRADFGMDVGSPSIQKML